MASATHSNPSGSIDALSWTTSISSVKWFLRAHSRPLFSEALILSLETWVEMATGTDDAGVAGVESVDLGRLRNASDDGNVWVGSPCERSRARIIALIGVDDDAALEIKVQD